MFIALLDWRHVMQSSSATRWQLLVGRLKWLVLQPPWRRRLLTIALIVAAHVAVLTVTYRAVIFDNRTLLTGAVTLGTEAGAPPYGYPGPALQGFNEVDPGASSWQFVPQIRKAHQELSQGELPLWDANVMLGVPLAGDPIHGLLNPLTWPLVASPSNGAWDAWLLSRLLLAGLLCTALAWYLGLRPAPATIAGLVYMMSGVFQVRATTIQTDVMAMLPLLILAFEACVRKPGRRSAALLAVAVASTLLFGMPEEAFLCLAFAAMYFVVRVLAEALHGRRAPRMGVVYAGLGGATIGILFGLPMLLPFIEYVGVGWTVHQPGAHNGLSISDAGQLLSLVGPHWNVFGPRFTTGTFSALDNWFGIGAIFLALLGIFSRAFPRGVRALLVATAVLVEAKTVGFPGWFNDFVGNLPILSRITLPAYVGVFVSLAIALLAGAGLQRLQDRAVKPLLAMATALGLAAVVVAAAPSFLAGTTVRWPEIRHTVVILAMVVAGSLLAAYGTRWLHRAGLFLTAGAVATELVLLATPGVQLPLRFDPLSPTPTATYLQQVMPTGSGRSYSATGILYPTTNRAFNIDDVRDLDAIYIDRAHTYLQLFVAPGLFDRFDGFGSNAADYIHNPFFDALNVKYILVAPSPSTPAAVPPADQYTLVEVAADGVSIYRNRDAAPRAQVVFDVTAAPSEQDAAMIMRKPGFDPTKSAVVETHQTLPVAQQAPVPARIAAYSDGQLTVDTDTSQPGTLVVADAYYPGWQAELDGIPTNILAVDIAFRGVQVAAGKHTVTMTYRPQSFQVGVLGLPAGLIVFGVGGWAVPAVVRARRR
jgi:hypothetical protein